MSLCEPSLAKCCSRSEEHTSELQSRQYLVCRLLLEKKNQLPDEVVARLLGDGQCLDSAAAPDLGRETQHLLLEDRARARSGKPHRLPQGARRGGELVDLVGDERNEQRSHAQQEQRWPVEEARERRLLLLQQHGGGQHRREAQHSERDVHHSSLSARSASATVVFVGSTSSAFFHASRASAALPSF